MVSATGTYDPQKQVLVPGRLHDGETGYWVVSAFAVTGRPGPERRGASPQTWIPVARGWVADPADAGAPPSGTIELTGRLLPSEAPLPNTDPGTRTSHAPSPWPNSSTSGTSAATRASSPPRPKWPAAPTSARRRRRRAEAAATSAPSRPAQKVNWLNLFYSVEWVVFAGFALFIWWRLVKDDYRRDLEDALDDDDGSEDTGPPETQPRTSTPPNLDATDPTKGTAMIEPKPAIQPQQTNATGTATGKKRRFGGTRGPDPLRPEVLQGPGLPDRRHAAAAVRRADCPLRLRPVPLRRRNQRRDRPAVRPRASPTPSRQGVIGGVNLSVAVLIVHGWMYVVYLMSNFRLWSLMRWPFAQADPPGTGRRGAVPVLHRGEEVPRRGRGGTRREPAGAPALLSRLSGRPASAASRACEIAYPAPIQARTGVSTCGRASAQSRLVR